MSPDCQQIHLEDVNFRKVSEATAISNDVESTFTANGQHWSRKTQTKVDLRLLPVLFCLGFIVAIDGTNLGQARVRGLEDDLQMREGDFSVAAMVYYLPCILLAVPSNIILHHCRKPSSFLASAVFLCGMLPPQMLLYYDLNIGQGSPPLEKA